jgi:hypothetical protein
VEGLRALRRRWVAGLLAAQLADEREELLPVLEEAEPVVAERVPRRRSGAEVGADPGGALLKLSTFVRPE